MNDYYTPIFVSSDYVAHSGIKGQKWGVRNYQNNDNTWTAAGRARYGWAANHRIDPRNSNHIGQRGGNLGSKPVSSIRGNNASGTKKKGLTKGLTKGQKTAIGVGIAAAAATALVAYDLSRGDQSLIRKGASAVKKSATDGKISQLKDKIQELGDHDQYIKAGTKYSRIQKESDFNNDYAFYATYKKRDVDEYIGLYSHSLKRQAKGTAKANHVAELEEKLGRKLSDVELKDIKLTDAEKSAIDNMDIYQVGIKTTKSYYRASNKNASKVANELVRDETFKNNLVKSIDETSKNLVRPQQQRIFQQAKDALAKDESKRTLQDKKNIYTALNITLTRHAIQEENDTQNAFYGAMRKRGYGEIWDLNDQKFSSFHSKAPVINFAGKESSTADAVRKIGKKEQDSKYVKWNAYRGLKEGTTSLPDTVGSFIYNSGRTGVSKIKDYYESGNARNAVNKLISGAKNERFKASEAIRGNAKMDSRINTLYNTGVPVEKIAKQLKIAPSTVYSYLEGGY